MTTPNSLSALTKRRAVIIADLTGKVEAEDWHGVADAAMDLREVDARLAAIRQLQSLPSVGDTGGRSDA